MTYAMFTCWLSVSGFVRLIGYPFILFVIGPEYINALENGSLSLARLASPMVLVICNMNHIFRKLTLDVHLPYPLPG